MLTFGGFAGWNDFALPNAGCGMGGGSASFFLAAGLDADGGISPAASASEFWGGGATTAVLISGGGTPFLVCLAITSRRCFSRRRSSRHSRNATKPCVDRAVRALVIAANKRPNEKCVEMMIDRKIIVTTMMREPVRLRYSDSSPARNSPAEPPARNGLPARSRVPNTRLRNALMQEKNRNVPVAFVAAASTSRHQK